MTNSDEIKALIRAALAEDVGGGGDITTAALVPAGTKATASMLAKQGGVLCGIGIAREVFKQVNASVDFREVLKDGDALAPGVEIARVSGPAAAILTAERTALNFVQRLSGVATLTRKFVDAVKGTGARICDTRKTTPGWRKLEKYAVACGGGLNHRMGLHDAALIKDNHIDICRKSGMSIAQILARFAGSKFPVEIEARTLDDVRQCIDAGAAMILLDNMSTADMRKAVEMGKSLGREVVFEASGNVTLERAREIALTGVGRISVGALTHSAPALDVSLKVAFKE